MSERSINKRKRPEESENDDASPQKPWDSFSIADLEELERLTRNQIEECAIPVDLSSFLGFDEANTIPSDLVKCFWYHIKKKSLSINALLRKYNNRGGSDIGFLSILGSDQDSRDVVREFLEHLRTDDPVHDAALQAYNKNSWRASKGADRPHAR
ncbi:hypothetical protein CYMTET_47728 [Cymbomonas tetramitiformis]|uniref:Uncharacterized protein n=1 Tax=Cymbomonas tetramitiformis TaxID=36881 RepID=A0AAE0BV52_9CHLO|nr:hypothetical protein CYMTET_47728 [Cymbomonas tetramitiformis]